MNSKFTFAKLTKFIQDHRRRQDFVWGAVFSKKVDELFCRRLQRPSVTRPAKTVLKIDSCSGWGCTSCPGGALSHFPCKLRLKNFFSPPWGAGAPTAPPGYAYVQNSYRRGSCTSKTAKIHRFVILVIYCFITIVLVAFY